MLLLALPIFQRSLALYGLEIVHYLPRNYYSKYLASSFSGFSIRSRRNRGQYPQWKVGAKLKGDIFDNRDGTEGPTFG